MIFSSICMPNLPRRVQSPSRPPSIKCQHCDPLPSSGRRGPHSPANATQRQTSLLEMLAWFSRWKELLDKRVKEKHATEYIFLQMKLGSASNRCCWDTSQSCTSTV